jgi:hypothetical protein
MITRRDLDEAIERIRGQVNQTMSECVRLAALYTIRDHLDAEPTDGYYGAASPAQETETVIGDYGDTEFLQMIAGMNSADVWPVMAEAMESLKIMEPRLYAGILRKLNK